jgi:bacterioferritin-associated ferredoxin
VYVCSCFGVTEQQIREHADSGACTPRQIASASKAGTDCGSCVRSIQGILGRGGCPRREALERGDSALAPVAGPAVEAVEEGLLTPSLPNAPGVSLPAA